MRWGGEGEGATVGAGAAQGGEGQWGEGWWGGSRQLTVERNGTQAPSLCAASAHTSTRPGVRTLWTAGRVDVKGTVVGQRGPGGGGKKEGEGPPPPRSHASHGSLPPLPLTLPRARGAPTQPRPYPPGPKAHARLFPTAQTGMCGQGGGAGQGHFFLGGGGARGGAWHQPPCCVSQSVRLCVRACTFPAALAPPPPPPPSPLRTTSPTTFVCLPPPPHPKTSRACERQQTKVRGVPQGDRQTSQSPSAAPVRRLQPPSHDPCPPYASQRPPAPESPNCATCTEYTHAVPPPTRPTQPTGGFSCGPHTRTHEIPASPHHTPPTHLRQTQRGAGWRETQG